MNSIKQSTSMRRLLRFVLPIALVLCFLLSYIYDVSSIMISTINSLADFSQFINRKALFIFYNVILLFIARDSGLLAPCVNAMDVKERGEEEEEQKPILVEKALELEPMVESDKVLEVALVEVDEEEEKEEPEVEEIEEDLGVDELNKRCEEFIEKVKRDRILEASQLVLRV